MKMTLNGIQLVPALYPDPGSVPEAMVHHSRRVTDKNNTEITIGS